MKKVVLITAFMSLWINQSNAQNLIKNFGFEDHWGGGAA
jgi:hypothetical protein